MEQNWKIDTEHSHWIPNDNNSYHKQPVTNGHLCVGPITQ